MEKIASIIFEELNDNVYRTVDANGNKLNVIDAEDIKEIIPKIINKLEQTPDFSEVMSSRLRREIETLNLNDEILPSGKWYIINHLKKMLSAISCEEISET